MRSTWLFLGLTVVLTAAAGVARYTHVTAILAFVLAAAALAGLAWVVSFATEQVGERFGPAVTGVLQSTLGNLPEFFVVVFALDAGEVVVAKTALVGSVFANALLVLGLVVMVGAASADDGVMRFSVRLPKDNAILMTLTSFVIVLVGISSAANDRASHHILAISIVAAAVLLTTYLVWVVDYLRSDAPAAEGGGGRAVLSLPRALVLLGLGGVAAAFVSDWFIEALTPSMDRLGIPQAFAGLVIVAIAGNAVENTAGLVLARKQQADLAISVVKNSTAQITGFLYPALVLVSLLLGSRLTFDLSPVLVGALALTGVTLWFITSDGEATMFEGVSLVSLYVILAVLTFYE